MNISQKRIEKIVKESIEKCLNETSTIPDKKAIAAEKKFQKWKITFDEYMNYMIEELQSRYLNTLNLKIQINPSYNFSRSKAHWLAVYQARSGQIHNNIILVAINYPLLYSEMCKRHIDKDEFNIEAQARITIGHEIGHGLIDFIQNNINWNPNLENFPHLKELLRSYPDEEDIVEEFGEFLFPEATDNYTSLLDDAMSELPNFLSTLEN